MKEQLKQYYRIPEMEGKCTRAKLDEMIILSREIENYTLFLDDEEAVPEIFKIIKKRYSIVETESDCFNLEVNVTLRKVQFY